MEEEIVDGNSHLFCNSNNGTVDKSYVDGNIISCNNANDLVLAPSAPDSLYLSRNCINAVPIDVTTGFTLHYNEVHNPIKGFLNFIKSKCECRYSLSRIEKILRKKHSERTEKEKKIIKRIMQSSDKEKRPKITITRQEEISYRAPGIYTQNEGELIECMINELNCLPPPQIVDWRRRML
jgi:hypothetical protein